MQKELVLYKWGLVQGPRLCFHLYATGCPTGCPTRLPEVPAEWKGRDEGSGKSRWFCEASIRKEAFGKLWKPLSATESGLRPTQVTRLWLLKRQVWDGCKPAWLYRRDVLLTSSPFIAGRMWSPPLLLLRDLNEIMQVQCIAQGLARDTFSKRIFIEKWHLLFFKSQREPIFPKLEST